MSNIDWHEQWAQYRKWLHALRPDETVPDDTFHRKAAEWLQHASTTPDAVFALAAALRKLFVHRQAFGQWLLTLRGRIPARYGAHQEEAFEDGGPFTREVTYRRAWDDAFALPGAPPSFDVNDVLHGLNDLYWSDYVDLAMPVREPEPAMPNYPHRQSLAYDRPYDAPGFAWNRRDPDLACVFEGDDEEDIDVDFVYERLLLIDNLCTWVVRSYIFLADTHGFGLRADAHQALLPPHPGAEILEGEHKLRQLFERALTIYRFFLEFPDQVSAFVFSARGHYGANPALFAEEDYDPEQGGGMDVLFTRDIPHMLHSLLLHHDDDQQ
jgi:hypothetical protein